MFYVICFSILLFFEMMTCDVFLLQSLKNENDIAAMKRRKDHSTKLSLAAFQKQPVDSMHSNDIKSKHVLL